MFSPIYHPDYSQLSPTTIWAVANPTPATKITADASIYGHLRFLAVKAVGQIWYIFRVTLAAFEQTMLKKCAH